MGRRRLQPISQTEILDFSGGLNLRDALSELADNESPDCLNVTFDERGGVVKRLGRQRKNTLTLPGTPKNAYHWPSKPGTVIFQVGAAVYKTTDDFASWSLVATFTTTDRAGFTDYNGALVAVHPQDGVYLYDGTTWSLATAAVKGTCAASWQNKVFVGGDKRAGQQPRLAWCNAGNATLWTPADYNDLREKDDRELTALGLGQGMDVAGRPGLLVFKGESAYRVNSSSTGAYTTIDGAAGCAGPLAVAMIDGVVAVINKYGIYVTSADALNKLERVSDKVSPMFRSSQMNFALEDLFCAGVHNGRFVFSLPWGSSQAFNNRTLEYHPVYGWIAPHDFGAAAFTTYTKNDARLYAASPNSSYVFNQFVTGGDDGAAIAARYQTRWVKPEKGMDCSFRRLRLYGRGIFDLWVKLDYDVRPGELNNVKIVGSEFVWNDPAALWNSPAMIWGPTVYEDDQDFFSLGHGKAVSFVMKHTGTNFLTTPPVAGDGVSVDVGAFAAYSMTLDYVRLGLA